MRRGRIFIFLALILIIGLAVVALVFRQFVMPTTSPTSPAQATTVQVFIAGQNIPQGQPITEDVLSTISIPQESVVSVMYTADRRSELVGKTARYPLDQGVVITQAMVSDGTVAAGGPEWASKIPQGMTAISVPTSRLESVAFGVREGAHVDVNACFLFVDVDPSYQTELPNHVSVLIAPGTEVQTTEGNAQAPGVTLGLTNDIGIQGRTEVESAFQQGIYVIPSEPQRPRLVCQMVLQNVLVLKLGTFALEQAQQVVAEQPAAEGQPQAAPAVEIPDVLTLVVTPQDSVTLSYLVYGGAKITMTLRNVLDDSRVATEAATLQFLLSQYNIPVPAKLPYAMQPRVDTLSTQILPISTEPVPVPQE